MGARALCSAAPFGSTASPWNVIWPSARFAQPRPGNLGVNAALTLMLPRISISKSPAVGKDGHRLDGRLLQPQRPLRQASPRTREPRYVARGRKFDSIKTKRSTAKNLSILVKLGREDSNPKIHDAAKIFKYLFSLPHSLHVNTILHGAVYRASLAVMRRGRRLARRAVFLGRSRKRHKRFLLWRAASQVGAASPRRSDARRRKRATRRPPEGVKRSPRKPAPSRSSRRVDRRRDRLHLGG